MIDSHCHLDLDQFNHDRDAVINQAFVAGVTRYHIPGTEAHRWSNLVNLASSSFIDVSLGLHPYFISKYSDTETDEHLKQLRCYLENHNSKVFAVGECGLDAVIDANHDRQIHIFKHQIGLAKYFTKPLIVHARKTHHKIIQCLNDCKYEGVGIVHAFSGSVETAKNYVERGWKLGIGGTITYPRGQRTKETIRKIGIEHLVLETDSPDMPLFGFQGQRNVPARTVLVAEALSELFDLPLTEVDSITTQNYLSLVQ